MKAVVFPLNGCAYYLLFNARAMFAIDEQFGGTNGLLDKMQSSHLDGFAVLCQAGTLLAEQGELVRRSLGYDPGTMPDEAQWALLASPLDLAELRNAIFKAIALGYGRDVEGQDEVDLGLVELAQKKTKG